MKLKYSDAEIEMVKEQMDWRWAIDYAYSRGMYIPNRAQCEEFGLKDCWTSTTREVFTNCAYLGCDKHPVAKTNMQNVILINQCNYTPDTVIYRTGDEGDGTTKSE